MAFRDYICCADCGEKMVPDGHDSGREMLEEKWGDPEAATWTVALLCPDCLKKLRERVKELEAGVVTVRTADLPRRKPRVSLDAPADEEGA